MTNLNISFQSDRAALQTKLCQICPWFKRTFGRRSRNAIPEWFHLPSTNVSKGNSVLSNYVRYDSTAYESRNQAARNSFVSAFGPALDPSWPVDGLWHMRVEFFIEIRKGPLQYRTPASPCCPLCSFNRIMFAAVHIFEEKNIVRNQLGIVVNYARGLYPTRYTHSHNELHANTQLTTDSGFSWIQFLLVTSSPRTHRRREAHHFISR